MGSNFSRKETNDKINKLFEKTDELEQQTPRIIAVMESIKETSLQHKKELEQHTREEMLQLNKYNENMMEFKLGQTENKNSVNNLIEKISQNTKFQKHQAKKINKNNKRNKKEINNTNKRLDALVDEKEMWKNYGKGMTIVIGFIIVFLAWVISNQSNIKEIAVENKVYGQSNTRDMEKLKK